MQSRVHPRLDSWLMLNKLMIRGPAAGATRASMQAVGQLQGLSVQLYTGSTHACTPVHAWTYMHGHWYNDILVVCGRPGGCDSGVGACR